MLEYYTMEASYLDSMKITEDLFTALLPPQPIDGNDKDPWEHLRPPFLRITMDEAFEKYAGFKLSTCTKPEIGRAHV